MSSTRPENSRQSSTGAPGFDATDLSMMDAAFGPSFGIVDSEDDLLDFFMGKVDDEDEGMASLLSEPAVPSLSPDNRRSNLTFAPDTNFNRSTNRLKGYGSTAESTGSTSLGINNPNDRLRTYSTRGSSASQNDDLGQDFMDVDMGGGPLLREKSTEGNAVISDMPSFASVSSGIVSPGGTQYQIPTPEGMLYPNVTPEAIMHAKNKKSKRRVNNILPTPPEVTLHRKDGKKKSEANIVKRELTAEEKEAARKRRLERNRESARQSRLRKKHYHELLHETIRMLSLEIDALSRTYFDRLEQFEAKRLMGIVAEIDQPLENSAQDDVLEAKTKAYYELAFGDAKQHIASANKKFDELLHMVLPRCSKYFVVHRAKRRRESLMNRSEGSSASDILHWKTIQKELNLSEQQRAKLAHFCKGLDTEATNRELDALRVMARHVDTLRRGVLERIVSVRSHFQLLMKILTPSQSAKYIVWFEKNRDKLMRCGFYEGFTFLPEGPGSVCENVANGENPGSNYHDAQQVMRKSAGSVTFADLFELMTTL